MDVIDIAEDPEWICLYADGSFSDQAGVGAWAFRAPAINLEGAGTADGKSVLRFEFLAVLNGLEAIADLDTTGLPIQVFSDCDQTVAMVKRLRAGLPLKNPDRYADRTDLIPRLQAVLEQREVSITRFGLGRLEHQACHRLAAAKLRETVDNDPKVRHEAALKRQRSRLTCLAGERGSLLKSLEKIDEDISLVQVEIAALELSMRQIVEVTPLEGTGQASVGISTDAAADLELLRAETQSLTK